MMDEETLTVKPFKRDADEGFGVKAPPRGKRRCIVVVPKRRRPATRGPGGAVTGTTSRRPRSSCCGRGFHIAFITPDPGKAWDAWYAFLTEKHGLSKKPAFIGMSKGGVNEYDWATVNPDKVSCIYADNPAIRPGAFAKLGELARNDVPLLNICGSLDFLAGTPHAGHREPLSSAGRPDHRDDQGGGRPSSAQPAQSQADRGLDRGERPAGTAMRPDFADETFTKSSYYSLETRTANSRKKRPTPPAAGRGSRSATTATTPRPRARGGSRA